MNVLIDMGNSRLKSALYDDGRMMDYYSEAYAGRSPIECLTEYLSGKSDVIAVAVVSVLGAEFQTEVRALCQKLKIKLNWAASTAQAKGITSNYIDPESLGSDRFVALVGAKKLYPNQYCIVVDCGTAVTVDALTNEGVFCGGVIIPGLQLWGDSLTGRANQLNAHQLDHPSVFAKNTAQAIGSGSLYGLVGAIGGVCERMEAQLRQGDADISIVRLLCGGDADLIAAHTSLSFKVLPHLVLTGLAEFTE